MQQMTEENRRRDDENRRRQEDLQRQILTENKDSADTKFKKNLKFPEFIDCRTENMKKKSMGTPVTNWMLLSIKNMGIRDMNVLNPPENFDLIVDKFWSNLVTEAKEHAVTLSSHKAEFEKNNAGPPRNLIQLSKFIETYRTDRENGQSFINAITQIKGSMYKDNAAFCTEFYTMTDSFAAGGLGSTLSALDLKDMFIKQCPTSARKMITARNVSERKDVRDACIAADVDDAADKQTNNSLLAKSSNSSNSDSQHQEQFYGGNNSNRSGFYNKFSGNRNYQNSGGFGKGSKGKSSKGGYGNYGYGKNSYGGKNYKSGGKPARATNGVHGAKGAGYGGGSCHRCGRQGHWWRNCRLPYQPFAPNDRSNFYTDEYYDDSYEYGVLCAGCYDNPCYTEEECILYGNWEDWSQIENEKGDNSKNTNEAMLGGVKKDEDEQALPEEGTGFDGY